MKILSVDVGIKNLAICILCDRRIELWNVYDLGSVQSTTTVKLGSLKKALDPIDLETVDLVLIEKQPYCNPKMRVISSAMHMYFVMKGLTRILDYSGKHKLKLCMDRAPDVKGKAAKYYSNKKRAIETTRDLIKVNDPTWEHVFTSSKKKDDLADCYLQGLSYFDIKVENSESLRARVSPATLKTKLKARWSKFNTNKTGLQGPLDHHFKTKKKQITFEEFLQSSEVTDEERKILLQ